MSAAQDFEAYVAELRAQHRESAFTLWRGAGMRRAMVGTATRKAKARELAHELAVEGRGPVSVWANDGDEPVLVVGSRRPPKGPRFAVERSGRWAKEQRDNDIEYLRGLIAKPMDPDGVEHELPPHRARAAARWIKRGLDRQRAVDVRITRDGLRAQVRA